MIELEGLRGMAPQWLSALATFATGEDRRIAVKSVYIYMSSVLFYI